MRRTHHAARAATLFSLLALVIPQAATGQSYFGKNKVKYKDFQWSVLETDHFEIHFYEDEYDVAIIAGRMAERAYERLSRLLEHEISKPVPVILYASHADFEQTNVAPGFIGEGTGGFTEFAKRRVTLPFTGSLREFDHVLTHELVHAFQVDILYGGERKTALNPFRFRTPLWIMEGMAEFLAHDGLDPQTEMWLRDASIEGYLDTPSDMTYVQDLRAYRFGQGICAYIAFQYGTKKLGRLLHKIRELRKIDEAFEETLGDDLAELSSDYLEYQRRRYYPQIDDFDRIDDRAEVVIASGGPGSRLNVGPSVSPDGGKLAFFSDRGLTIDLYIEDLEDSRSNPRRFVTGSRNSSFESLRFFRSSAAWSPDGSLIALGAKAGSQDALYLLDARNGRTKKKLTFGLDEIRSPCFHPDGTQIAFVGLTRGISDLFLVDLESGALLQLTHDVHLEAEPQFSPDGTRIAVVTDRGPDTDPADDRFAKPQISIYNVFLREFEPLPRMIGHNRSPQWSPDGESLLFVSDRSGVSNLYLFDFEKRRTHQMTNFRNGITNLTDSGPVLSWCRDTAEIFFSAYSQGSWSIYKMADPREWIEPDPAEGKVAYYDPILYFTEDEYEPETMEQEVVLRSARAHKTGRARRSIEGEYLDVGDSFGASWMAEAGAADSASPPFDGETLAATSSDSDAVSTGSKDPGQPDPVEEERESKVNIRPYRLKFSPDFLVSNTGTHTQFGIYGQTSLALSDLLGNHTITLGATISGSLAAAHLLLAYRNRTHRTEYGFSLFQFRENWRQIYSTEGFVYETETWRGAELLMVKPFDKFTRVEGRFQVVGAAPRRYERSTFGYLSPQGSEGKTELFTRPMISLVFDNTLHGYLGPVWGTRSRLTFEQTFGDRSYSGLSFDLRRYWNTNGHFVFAARFLAAASVGVGERTYFLGGPHLLRGYPYGKVQGNRVGLVNLEFRFPLIHDFWIAWPVSLRLIGIQGVVFFDAGAAIDSSTRLFTSTNTPLFRTEDLITSAGFGMRMSLGFFLLKLDFAQRADGWYRDGGLRTALSVGANF